MLRRSSLTSNPWFPQEHNLKLKIKKEKDSSSSRKGGFGDLINSGIGTETRVRKVQYPLSPFSTTPEGDEDAYNYYCDNVQQHAETQPSAAPSEQLLNSTKEKPVIERSVAKETTVTPTENPKKGSEEKKNKNMKSAAATKSNGNMGSHYVIGCKLGSGSFGTIYHCRNENKRKDYAIKMESAEDADGSSQLAQEAKLLLLLENHVGFCKFAYCDFDFSHFPDKNLLVMDLLGPTLEDLFNLCNRVFTLKTVCLIAEQCVNRIEILHSKNYIHRDVKPENFMIGSGKKDQRTLYLGDFGLCKKYRDPKTLQHIPYRDGRSLSGTARYASLNAQNGVEQSRRDDMEGLFYTLLYLYKSELPWQGIQAPNKQEKHKRMLRMKKTMSIAELCMNCPPEFSKYLMYVRKLKFDETPDYEYLRNLFRNMLRTWYNREFMKDYVHVNSREIQAPGTTNGSEERKECDEDDFQNSNNTYKARKSNLSTSNDKDCTTPRYGSPAREYSYNQSAFDKYNSAPPSSVVSGTGDGSESGSFCFERANSFAFHKDNLQEALFDWEKQRSFHPKMKCSGMPELSEEDDSARGKKRGTTSNKATRSKKGNKSQGKTDKTNDPPGDDHNARRSSNVSNGVNRGLSYESNLNYLMEHRDKDVSNPRTVPGNPVMMERLHGASGSRKNVTPRQSSGAMAEVSRNSTARFGKDDDRVGKKGNSALTRFIGFCNKKNPLPNTYTPR